MASSLLSNLTSRPSNMTSVPSNSTSPLDHMLHTWNSTLSMTRQGNVNMVIFHSIMFCVGVIGNSFLLFCALRSARAHGRAYLSRRGDNTRHHTAMDLVLEMSMLPSSRGRYLSGASNRVIQQNCVAFHENITINSLVGCGVVVLPLIFTHMTGRYMLGESLCNLMAQIMEILYITRAAIFFTLSVYMFCAVIWPGRTIITKVPQVRMLTIWLWIAVIFLIIWLNVLTQSSAKLNHHTGLCTILNPESLTVTRLLFYSIIYLTSFLSSLVTSLGVLVKRARGVGEAGISPITPSLLLFVLAWTPLYVSMACKHFHLKLGPVGELLTTLSPEIEMACSAAVVLACNCELWRGVWRGVGKCYYRRARRGNGRVGGNRR